jgi:hypothetical protein
VSKLQSLADRPATKEKITDCVCSLDETCEFSRQVESELSKLRDLLDRAKGLIKNTQSYCTEAHVCSLDECYGCQFDVRDNYNRGFPNCTYEEQREQWLKDLAEVCGE